MLMYNNNRKCFKFKALVNYFMDNFFVYFRETMNFRKYLQSIDDIDGRKYFSISWMDIKRWSIKTVKSERMGFR